VTGNVLSIKTCILKSTSYERIMDIKTAGIFVVSCFAFEFFDMFDVQNKYVSYTMVYDNL
jgi:hypothetical protein